ncbi:MAG: AAA family ATPase [Bacteroidaceae bacterium]|nr:AAA family ATPase [Bacteroidaceae bacterium]
MEKRKAQKKELTLLQAIEKVVEFVEDGELSKESLRKAKPYSSFLAKSFGITELQAVFFCISLELGPGRVDLNDIARFLGMSKIRALSYADEIGALVRRRLLRYRNAKDEEEFDVNAAVIKALKHNEVYQVPRQTGLNCAELFDQLEILFEDLDNDTVTVADLIAGIRQLFEDNSNIRFVQEINRMKLRNDDMVLLVFFCCWLANKEDDDIRFNQIEDLFGTKAEFNSCKARLRSGDHCLLREKLIEHICVNGIADTTRYKLTEDAKKNLLAEMKITVVEESISNLLQHESIIPKELFYPAEIENRIADLATFFTPEKYAEIRERMQQRGFRQGFACLFYGGPGTGKTETVYQLAKQTGRDIMVVDVPQIKSKWVGDSEKNIKALFDRYREISMRCTQVPILLFNEADAIIGMRKNGATSAVDKMENSIQNIILQEMETLDGIMIATTNLQENLDPAFERRFLYKIKFEKPDASVRARIWQQMIPELSESDAATLAASHDFSGGQIENIARKHAINCVLRGNEASPLNSLLQDCACEKLASKEQRKRVGF